MIAIKLHINYDSYVFPLGWINKMLLAGETPNTFLLTRISNINIFFIMNKKKVVIYSNFQDKFASTNLIYNLKKEEKTF